MYVALRVTIELHRLHRDRCQRNLEALDMKLDVIHALNPLITKETVSWGGSCKLQTTVGPSENYRTATRIRPSAKRPRGGRCNTPRRGFALKAKEWKLGGPVMQ